MKKFIAHIILIFLIPIHLIVLSISLLLRSFACWLGEWGRYFSEFINPKDVNQN